MFVLVIDMCKKNLRVLKIKKFSRPCVAGLLLTPILGSLNSLGDFNLHL